MLTAALATWKISTLSETLPSNLKGLNWAVILPSEVRIGSVPNAPSGMPYWPRW